MGSCRKMNQSKGYVYALFAIVVVGTGLGGMTQTALNAMADVVLSDLGTQIGWGQWLATIYIFCMGAAVPLASYVQRKLSVRSLILYSYGLYLIGSLCDCLAVNFPMLIIGRVLEALGTGVLMPLLQTIAMTRFPENRHGTAMGIAGIALGFAPNIGPVVGGALCTAFSWRAMFLILACASAVLIVCALAVVREREVKDAAAHLDVTSLVFSTFGFGGLLLGFTAAANMGLTEPLVWVPVLVGIACVALFVTRQRTISEPLLDLRIFTFREYRVSIVAQCLLYGCFMGMTLIIPLTVIEAGGHNAFEAGLVLLPGALAALVFEPGAGMATDRFGVRRAAIFGGCFLVEGALLCSIVPSDAPLWLMALGQTLRCVGLTTLIPTTTSWGLGSLGKAGLTTHGSAGMIMSRQIAASLATAVMVFLIGCFPLSGEFMGFHAALGFSALLALGCLLVVLAKIPRSGRGANS